jgi:hypothetical protein
MEPRHHKFQVGAEIKVRNPHLAIRKMQIEVLLAPNQFTAKFAADQGSISQSVENHKADRNQSKGYQQAHGHHDDNIATNRIQVDLIKDVLSKSFHKPTFTS